MDRFSAACRDIGLTISLRSMNIIGQYRGNTRHHNRRLRTRCCLPVHIPRLRQQWHPLNGYRDIILCKRIGKVASPLSRLTTRVRANPEMSVKKTDGSLQCLCYQHTAVCQQDIDYVHMPRRREYSTATPGLNYLMISTRRILGISWQDKESNADALSCASRPSMYHVSRQRRRQWLGYVHLWRMVASKKTSSTVICTGYEHGLPHLRHKNVCMIYA